MPRHWQLAIALVCTLVVAPALAAERPPVAGLKAEHAPSSDAAAARGVPGVTPWGAVVLSILMLSSSTIALYGGRLAAARSSRTTTPEAQRLAETAPRKSVKPLDQPWRNRRGERRQQAHAQRQQGSRRRAHGANSQTMKRRLASGCRGPLRKT